jgi:hypothetical protein
MGRPMPLWSTQGSHRYEEEIVPRRPHTKFVREGQYGAEVDVELIDEDVGWSPYLSLEDAQKLDHVREALRQGDLKRAVQLARVFKLTPITVGSRL